MPPFTPEPTLCELCLSREFSDVRLLLLRRVCGLLFFLHYLQAFDLLEGVAHDAAVRALVPTRGCFCSLPFGLARSSAFPPSLASVCLPRVGCIYSTEEGALRGD